MTDFNEFALIAPLESGAGIKLKTLEAWSASIPVIGTQQAFSGLPKSIWSPGGISESSIECLAALCADHDQFLQKVGRLKASKSFTQYQKIIQKKANWLQ